ncbi:unnamed protein product, partial [Ectocarpus sp. 13 AM-2016]
MGDVRGQGDAQSQGDAHSPRQCLGLVKTFALFLRDKYGAVCQALEEEHLDEAIEKELEGAPWLSPFLPSSPEAMCSFVQIADLSADDVVLDVGCGDGRVLVTMAKVLGCRGIGIDVSQACISSAEHIGRAEGVSELLSWHCTDATRPGVLDELGLSVTTVVFLYAYPTLLAQLEVLLTRLRRGGARVFTLQYHLVGEGWKAAKSCEDEPSKRLYSALPP